MSGKNATAAQIAELVVEPMQALYQAPANVVVATRVGQYVAALSGFTPSELAAGWRSVVAKHGTHFWPVPAKIVEACLAARAALTPDPATLRGNKEAANRRAAEAAMHEPVGVTARIEGYSLSLYEWICKHGPRTEYLTGKMRDAAAFRDRWARGDITEEERNNPFLGDGIRMAKVMLEAERAHAAKYLVNEDAF